MEPVRYGINGVFATIIHYGFLTINLHVLHFSSAGLANFTAALFGISASFVGSRYFVFALTGERFFTQGIRFAGLYSVTALLHGLFLWTWTDWHGLDYRVGFIVATALQVSVSYVGNKRLVFKK
jgi:putative flippase GtrA